MSNEEGGVPQTPLGTGDHRQSCFPSLVVLEIPMELGPCTTELWDQPSGDLIPLSYLTGLPAGWGLCAGAAPGGGQPGGCL